MQIDGEGVLRSRASFDRESLDRLAFHVVASDGTGPSSHSSAVRVVLSILDKNDNAPKIHFNTSLYHTVKSEAIHLRIGQYMSVKSKLIEFSASDADLDKNGRFEFHLDGLGKLPVQLSRDGHLVLAESLEHKSHSIYRFRVVCEDTGPDGSLSANVSIFVEVTDSSEFCIQTFNDGVDRRFLNRDLLLSNERQTTARSILFEPEFVLGEENKEDSLDFELLNHRDLIELKLLHVKAVYSVGESRARLEISLKPELNISQLVIGKYEIQIRVRSKEKPSCGKIEQFTLLIGNNFMNEREIVSYVDGAEHSEGLGKRLECSLLM